MKLIAFLNKTRNDEFRAAVGDDFFANGGYANGYVAVPPEHPYHGKDYGSPPVDVHCGLTFAASASEVNKYWKNIEILGEDTNIPDDYWAFGFDTLHCDDNLQNCPREMCIAETLRLKEQLEQLSTN